MPTFGLLPSDVVANFRGDVLGGVTLSLYATKADAEASTGLLATVTSDSLGRWSYVHAALSVIWVRTPPGVLSFSGAVFATIAPDAIADESGVTGAAVDELIAAQHALDNSTYAHKVAASGDTSGVTDKVNIEAALAAGGALLDPGAIYWAAGLNLPTTLFHLDARMATVKLPNSAAAGTHVIQTNGFAALTGTGSSNGMTRSTIRNLIVDGNKANNATGGKGMALYGWAYTLDNVICQNAHSDGLYTEWGADRSGTGVDTLMESHFGNIRCSNNDGNGWTFRGPHDSMIEGVVAKMNAGWGFVAEVVNGGNGAGAHVRNLNAWNNANGLRLATSFTGYDIAASAPATAILIDTDAGLCQLTDFIVSGAVGIEVRSQFHRLSGQAINCTTDALKINGAAGCMIDLKASACVNVINWANDAGDNIINLSTVTTGTQTMETGVGAATTMLVARRAGNVAWSYFRWPGNLAANAGTADQVLMGACGPGGQPAINCGGPTLYRNTDSALRTAGYLCADTGVAAGYGGTGGFDQGHLTIGGYSLWIDTSGRLRVKATVPTSDTDGTVVGAQT